MDAFGGLSGVWGRLFWKSLAQSGTFLGALLAPFEDSFLSFVWISPRFNLPCVFF
jgi:hypothetical protein